MKNNQDMEEMKMSQWTKFLPILLRNGTVIGTDMHTCLPLPNQSIFKILFTLYFNMSLYFYLNKGE